MVRPNSLFFAALVSIVAANFASSARAQTAQYPAVNAAQLAFATPPSAVAGAQMLRSEASVLFSNGQYVAAGEVYKRLLQLGSMEASDRYWLGESLYHANNFQQAVTAFEQAVQLNPKLTQAYVRLTETYLALHQKEKAVQSCTSALSNATDPYMKDQLNNLMKVSIHQERKPTRSHESRSTRLPAES